MDKNDFARGKAGQNMLEYALLLALVVSLLILVLGPTGIFTRKVDVTLNTAINWMQTQARGD